MSETMTKPVESPVPTEGPGSNEYEDFHAFFHSTMNDLADRLFTHELTIDYPTLLQVFCVMKSSAPLDSTAADVLNDHMDALFQPLMGVLFGHD